MRHAHERPTGVPPRTDSRGEAVRDRAPDSSDPGLSIFLLAGFALAAPEANAGITYSIIDHITTPGGSITGTITTDGQTGLINSTDITNWDITVTAPTFSFELSPSNSTAITNTDGLTATNASLSLSPTSLTEPPVTFIISEPGSAAPFVRWTATFNAGGSPTAGLVAGPDAATGTPFILGPINPATAPIATFTAVPEPSTLILAAPVAACALAYLFVRRYRHTPIGSAQS